MLVSGLAAMALVTDTEPASAALAVPGDQQWVTDITGAGTEADPFVLTFGSTGVTATVVNSVLDSCGGNVTPLSAVEDPDYGPGFASFITPAPPADSNAFAQSVKIKGCAGQRNSFVFSEPSAPRLHVDNLDASRVVVAGTDTDGDPISITTVSKNGALGVVGNEINKNVRQAKHAGCVSPEGCGSFDLVPNGKKISSFEFSNDTLEYTGPSGDGWLWSLSIAATPEPWTCDAYGYLFQTPGAIDGDHNVTQVDLATGETTELGATPDYVNAVGYNTTDDFFYAWDIATKQPVRINPDLSLTQLGLPATLPASTYITGDFDDAGHLWIATNAAPTGWAEIDYAAGSATYGEVLQQGAFPASNVGIPSDWSWINGTLYGTSRIGGAGALHLAAFDPTSHTLTDAGALAGPNDWSGAGATYTDGTYLYGSDNAEGGIYRIDPTDGTTILVTQGLASSGNDGARCATAPIPTITVNKQVEGRYASGDQFTVGLDNAAGDTLTSATTAGTSVSASTTDWPVSQGATYTITDAMASGSSSTMESYTATAVCTAEDGSTATLGGAAPNWTLTVSNPTDYDCTVTNAPNAPLLTIKKTSSANTATRIGDTVSYTVTATNPGPAAYTADNPAVVSDSLAGVLDDATYNGDATTSRGEVPSYSAPTISWAGPLNAGQSVELTYSVVLQAGGDGDVKNVAWQPGNPLDPNGPAPVCDPRTAEGTDPVTGEPCASIDFLLPSLTIAKSASTTQLPADGGTVDYTVTVTNNSGADFTADAPATVSDDLSKVLDDGELTGGPTASAGTATFDHDGQTIDWSGPLASGQSATITYTVTYDANKAGGDHVLLNVACVPTELVQAGDNPCRSVQVPGAALQQRKSVDPASGTAVTAGQDVTYTLTFQNTGQTDATVDTADDLSGVLDDATLNGDAVVSNPALTATLNGDQLAIAGTVPAGQTYTVSYTVTVNAFADQGDHELGNVLGVDCEVGDPTCRTNNPIKHVSVHKVADPVQGANTGDTVNYTVTVTNDGGSEYTQNAPAVVADDLTGVIDDAVFDQLTASATAGALAYAPPVLTWTGPLAIGDSVTITYSVTVTNAGDHSLVNTAGAVCVDPEICDPPVIVVEDLPHVVPSKTSDPADGSDVQAGDVVTYTLSWTNDGKAAGPVDSTDDLSNVLDDADVSSEPVSSDAAVTATRTSDEIRVVGDIQAGQTVTVTYQVTVKPNGQHGDNDLANVLTPDIPQVCDGGEGCEPPHTDHPVGDLDDWKSVDPASGTTVQPGTVMTYTLHFENSGKAAVDVARDDDLSMVLDDADLTADPTASDAALTVSSVSDGRFSVTGSLDAGQAVTVTYTVTVKADGQRGDDQLGNFLLDPGQAPPEDGTCVPADDQKPDCTVNYVSNVVVTKTSDPKSGTDVASGQSVTYTLTFTNVGTNAKAADAPVDEIDYMKDVLDDATLTGGPTASDAALVAKSASDAIHVTGALASGQVVRVTYTVKVKAYGDQGNHSLGNVIARNGDEPICVPDSQLCTTHRVTPPVPGLADTGSDVTAAGLLAALLAGLGGIGLLIARRRRGQVS